MIKKTHLLLLTALITYNAYAQPQQHPTMILIHGALFTSAVWLPVQNDLQNRGYNVITINTPGRLNDGIQPQEATLFAAVKKVCDIANLQPGPVILVGHNQAGAIITQATERCGTQIKGLVYLAAIVPWPGEKPFDLLSDQDNYNFDLVAPLDTKTGLSQPDDNAPIKALFMADTDDTTAKHAMLNMVPESIRLAYDTLNYNKLRFDQIPKYYIKTSQDLIISPDSQNKYITRQAMNRVFLLQTSHTPFISQPTALAKILADINTLESVE